MGLSGQPYVYAGANPVNATDPSGQILETIADGVAIGMDLHDIQSEGLNWGNGTALVLDVAGASRCTGLGFLLEEEHEMAIRGSS